MPRLTTIVALAGGLWLAAACGDSNEPNDSGGGGRGPLSMRVLEHSDVSVYTEQDFAIAACGITFAGQSDRDVSWRHLRFIFFADSQMTQPFDTAIASGDDVGSNWSDEFGGAAEPYSSWSLSATIPFVVRSEFFYLSGGTQYSTDPVDVPCLVPTPPNSGPPVLTNVTLAEDGDGVITPSEPVTVGYHLEAPAGSWQGFIEVWGTGACDTVVAIANPVQVTLQSARAVMLPPSCVGTDTVHAGVTYFDVLGRVTFEQTVLPTFTPDTIPPGLATHYPPVGGEFFVGDSLRFVVEGSENRDLAYLIWEMGPALSRDSIVVRGRVVALQQMAIPVRPEWAGVPDLTFRYFLRDQVGLESNVIESPADTIHVYPTVTVPMVSRTVPGDVRNALFDDKRGRIYLAEGNFGRIRVVSAATLADVASYAVPQAAWGFDLTPSGDSIILVSPYLKKVGIIDLTITQLVADTFTYGGDGLSYWFEDAMLQVLANGKAYISTQEDGLVAEVDLATRTTRVLPLPEKAFLARSGDGTRALASTGTTMRVFRAGSADFSPASSEGRAVTRMDQAGNRIAVGLRIFDGDLSFLGAVRAPFTYNLSNTPRIALSSNGERIYYPSHPRSIIRANTGTRWSVERYQIPFSAQRAIQPYLAPDGSRMLVVESSNGTETRIVLLTLP